MSWFQRHIGKKSGIIGKGDGQSYVKVGCGKIAIFDRWCSAKEAKSVEQLRDIVLMEEFENCLPDKIATYLN